MRKNRNQIHIEGYVYQADKLALKKTGEKSKNPGTPYISGELQVIVDEEGMNVIPVHFTYVTEVYTKSKNPNATFTALKRIIDNQDKSWVVAGKEGAIKVKIDGSIALNDFYATDGRQVAAKVNEGQFVTIVTDQLCDVSERNTFSADMVITRVNHVDADPEKNINEDYTSVSGAVFNFRNEILPVEFSVKNSGGMNYFEGLGASNAEPVYTKVWGHIYNTTTKVTREEESAFGELAVTSYERKSKEWVISGAAKVPYDFGDENVMTAEELVKAQQDREVHWADIKKRTDDYRASLGTPTAAATPVKNANFTF